jgi:UDP-N-acetyl-D-mannosaminuronic acid dehydrogenase
MTPQALEELVAIVSPDISLFETAQRITESKVEFFGLAVVVDSKRRVLGVINDGDYLRLLTRQADLSQKVETAMIRNPITVHCGMTHEEIIEDVKRQLRERNGKVKEAVRYVLVVDEDNVLVNVLRFVDLLSYYKRYGEKVAIYGQGYVGLTLSAALAAKGHMVTGIDRNPELIERLNNGDVHIHEPRLKDTVKANLDQGTLKFITPMEDYEANVIIISVGTPVDNAGKADLSAVISSCELAAEKLKRGDLVMFRSTLPVGCTRELIKPLLEKNSKLKAGHDFYLAFTPERTVEGRAMAELRSLPQVVGGLTPVCTQKAAAFWATLTDSVVHVDSLEAAELIKLLNNSFRDLSFSFSNAFALLCDNYNLGAAQIINAANEGYPRNKIPQPSPGVGGYCLTKDPYLYAAEDLEAGHAKLARTGRNINQESAQYPVKVLEKYANRHSLKISAMKVLIIGLAFKGWPETKDMRGSTSLEVAAVLRSKGVEVMGWDAIISPFEISEQGIKPAELFSALQVADAIMILNNHPKNTPEGLTTLCRGRKVLVFDGWSLLEPREVENIPGLTYATMGYMTPLKEKQLETSDTI